MDFIFINKNILMWWRDYEFKEEEDTNYIDTDNYR